jgi:4'-phosphopantetheinyl transferase
MINSPQNPTVILQRVSRADFPIDRKVSLPEDAGVVLYLLDLRSMADAESNWRELLSADEKERAARFHFERDRQCFCATRAVLRSLLGVYLEASPKELSFQYSDKGKPSLGTCRLDCELAFNVSHSGELALLGFSRSSQIGVDIEKIKDDFDTAAIASRFFSAEEQVQLSRLPADQQHQAFFRCWTRKEAFIKALGEGLSHPLDQFDVSLDASSSVSLTTRPEPAEAERWLLQAIDVGPSYAGAFAVSTP